MYAVQESCISWVYVETLRICCSWNLQLEDFWGSKNASLWMKEDILLFKRWPGHLYRIINFSKEMKNKQFLCFISKIGTRTFAKLWFCYLTPYSYSLTSAETHVNTDFSNCLFPQSELVKILKAHMKSLHQ